MLHRALPLVLALSAAGCAAGTEEPGSVGYVLLDREARAAGRLSQGEWDDAPVLPVALDTAEAVAFSSSAGRSLFELRPGMLAHVHGAAGAVEWLHMREDVSDERILVYGTREAAADLAQRVAGRLEGGHDGVFTVSAPDIFDRGSFLGAPDGVLEVAPEPVVQAAQGAGRAGGEKGTSFGAMGAMRALRAVPALPGDEGVRQAMLVGVYMSEGNALILDAAGGFELDDACSGELVGHGRYHTDGDRVVLDGEAASTVLALEAGALRDPEGGRFAPLIPPEEAGAVEPGGEP
jgi:hypothetical protein